MSKSSQTLGRAVCPLRMGATAGCATEMAADVGWGLPEMVRAKAFLPAGNENAGKDRSWKFIDLKFLKVLAGVVGGSMGSRWKTQVPKEHLCLDGFRDHSCIADPRKPMV